MSELTPQSLTKPLVIPLKMNLKPSTIIKVDVLNIENNTEEQINLTVVNRGVTVPVMPRTMKQYYRFFKLLADIPEKEVSRALNSALRRLDCSQWLNLTMQKWVYHGETLLKFAHQKKDKIIIVPRDDESIFEIKGSLLNKYWRKNNLPYRIVSKQTRYVED